MVRPKSSKAGKIDLSRKYLEFRDVTGQDGSQDVAMCKATTKIQISSLQCVLRRWTSYSPWAS